MSGEVVVVTPAASAVESYVKAKRMRALAVLDAKRLTSMPDVPTSAEAGMPQLLIVNWYVLAAPAGTSPGSVQPVKSEAARGMRLAGNRNFFSGLRGAPVP